MDPYLGEIRIVPLNFAPKGWALCNGQIMSVNTNQALFSVLGSVYGGNGSTTFALPDLRGRLGIGMSANYAIGSVGGSAANTLTADNLPAHSHTINISDQVGNTVSPINGYFANAGADDNEYGTSAPSAALGSGCISLAGGSAPIPNMQPYLALSFIIATVGIYPSRS